MGRSRSTRFFVCRFRLTSWFKSGWAGSHSFKFGYGFVPVNRSDMMVAYGPVEIGCKTYILPLRSVNVLRGRVEPSLREWNVSFQTWGPYETRVNDFTFDHYHMFRGESRILPGFSQLH
jgi:hypothetical protein